MTERLPALTAHFNRWFGPSRTQPSSAALAEALSSAPELDALLPLARFGTTAYQRVPVLRTEHYELRILCWLPGQSSAVHGHGASSCAFRILAGEATEHLLQTPSTSPVGSLRLRVGDVGRAEAGVVHQVGNEGAEPLITAHLYAPPLPVDQPSSAEGRQVVILGGGWCGAALAIHLLRSRDPDLRITLVEAGPVVGRGVAFGTPDGEHLLNVPAGKMSLDPNNPGDCLSFARARISGVHGHALLTRRLYGDYVQTRLAQAVTQSPSRLRLARASATRVDRLTPTATGWRWRVTLSDGRLLAADEVVLATGHGPARLPEVLEPFRHHPRLILRPDAPGALDAIGPDERLLLVGTGLTAVDTVLSLRSKGLNRPLTAVSRNGWWPRPHLETVGWTGPMIDLDTESAPRTAEGLARWLRQEVDRAWTQGIPWQAVLGAVRPFVSVLWARLPDAERGLFLTLHRSAWEVHRHRVPRATHQRLRDYADEGWLQTLSGGIGAVEARPDGFTVSLPGRDGALPTRFDRVVACMGRESDPRRFAAPLWQGLLEEGLVTADRQGLGLLTDPNGATLDGSGQPTGLWALGGLQRPLWFESSAVPELAEQAAALALALSARSVRQPEAALLPPLPAEQLAALP